MTKPGPAISQLAGAQSRRLGCSVGEGRPDGGLKTLIPANSGLELVAADNISERGEILGVEVPGGCFPVGHLSF
jgi:hypothetical protein